MTTQHCVSEVGAHFSSTETWWPHFSSTETWTFFDGDTDDFPLQVEQTSKSQLRQPLITAPSGLSVLHTSHRYPSWWVVKAVSAWPFGHVSVEPLVSASCGEAEEGRLCAPWASMRTRCSVTRRARAMCWKSWSMPSAVYDSRKVALSPATAINARTFCLVEVERPRPMKSRW